MLSCFFGRFAVWKFDQRNSKIFQIDPCLLSFHLIILQILEQENVAQHTLDFIHPHDVTEVASVTTVPKKNAKCWQDVGNLVQYQINVDTYICIYIHMDVSENSGTPIFGNTHI